MLTGSCAVLVAIVVFLLSNFPLTLKYLKIWYGNYFFSQNYNYSLNLLTFHRAVFTGRPFKLPSTFSKLFYTFFMAEIRL